MDEILYYVPSKFIIVTGGVVSGLGKGITTASIGVLLKSRGFKVTAIKIDPYVNVDAGTLRPTEHGEVWVTDDGGEIDQDLGHYERFLDLTIPKDHNITTGQVYKAVIERERRGEYLGKTVQIIPHVTDEIKRRILLVAEREKPDFILVEIGGVSGDYENIPFLEAVRQMKLEGHPLIFVHVTYMPILRSLGEMKTKPTQHSVKALREIGIQPDFIVCRSEKPIDEVRREKTALFTNVSKDCIISNPDVEIIYELPLLFEEQSFGDKILEKFGLPKVKPKLDAWRQMVERAKNAYIPVRFAIVGKYFEIGEFRLPDSYVSVIEALRHASWSQSVKPIISTVDSQKLSDYKIAEETLKGYHGIIVPGGFGTAGVDGKINAIRYAREHGVPYLGLCFGFQLAVVEFARNIVGLKDAHTTEVDPNTPHPVIDLLPWQKEVLAKSGYGATMRLGGQIVLLKEGSLAHRLYGRKRIRERFRHRYEVNPEYVEILESHGLVFSGWSEKDEIRQVGELPTHPFFIGSQYHPEFTSRPMNPNPLFLGFVSAATKRFKKFFGKGEVELSERAK